MEEKLDCRGSLGELEKVTLRRKDGAKAERKNGAADQEQPAGRRISAATWSTIVAETTFSSSTYPSLLELEIGRATL